MPLPGAPPANPSPAPTPAEPSVDWVYPAPRRIRPSGLAVTVWTTRLLLAATFGIFAWEAYHIIGRIWSAIANRTLSPFPWSNLFPLWSTAALLATMTVLAVGWFARGLYQTPETVHDPLRGPVSAPGQMVTVHRVPVRVLRGQSPPLATSGRHIQNSVHHLSFRPPGRPAHPAPTRIGRNQIRDRLPFLIR